MIRGLAMFNVCPPFSSIKFLHQFSLVNFAGFHRCFLFSKVMLKIIQMLIVYNVEKKRQEVKNSN